MKKLYLISVMAAALSVVACNEIEFNEVNTLNDVRMPVKVYADALVEENNPVTLVNFKDHASKDFSLVWEVGDTICVFNQQAEYTLDPLQMNNFNRVTYVVTAVNSTTGRATFEPKAGSDLSVFGSSDTFYASMGGEHGSWESNFLYSDNVIQSVLPATDNFIPVNRLDKASFIAVSKATLALDGSLTFQFHPVLGYFKITIPENCTVGKVRFYPKTTTPKSPNLSGYYQITLDGSGNFSSGARTNGATAGGSGNIVFYHREPGDTENSLFPAGSYYFPMLPDVSIRAVRCYSAVDTEPSYHGLTGMAQAAAQGKVIDLGTLPADS